LLIVTLHGKTIQTMELNDLIKYALAEDIGDGDHTSLSTIPSSAMGKARLIVKEEGILAGMRVAPLVFERVDPSIIFKPLLEDGTPIKPGDIAFIVEGPSISLLTSERLVLNFMQRMSGIATITSHYAKELDGLHTKVIDTRKTTPLMRALEKESVRIGGGGNHRFGLFDMILIKDNHVDFAGGIKQAINAAQQYLQKTGKSLKIEIEVRNFDELNHVLLCGGVDRIMLDNFNPEMLTQAVKIIDGRYETEASGGITLSTLRSYALSGVDYISVGALTHHIKSLDLSLKAF
jgi:nicotinate-nucleotide pyrophosphorylase (carboxylating)